jgi:hypothetical protein
MTNPLRQCYKAGIKPDFLLGVGFGEGAALFLSIQIFKRAILFSIVASMSAISVLSDSVSSAADEPTSAKESNVRAGSHLAVEAANLTSGFRLNEKAKKNIGVVHQPLGSSPYTLPASCLVYFGDQVGVYRFRQGWFKLVSISIDKKGPGNSVTFSGGAFQAGDEVAVQGAALLRVTEMDVFGGVE